MKTVKLFFGAMAIAVVSMLAAPQLNAQEAEKTENRDENGKIRRHPYLTNGAWANWFIQAAGGVNFFGDGGYTPALGGGLDVNVGKWFTPCIGARVGYSGLTGAEWSKKETILGTALDSEKNQYKQKFGFAYIHGDAMWNISNALGGYKESRFWDFVPYVHAGLLLTYERPTVIGAGDFGDKELAVGAGLLNVLRLHKRLDLTLDVRGILMNGNHHAANGGLSGAIQTTLGLSVNLGKTDWTRAADYHNPEDTDKISAAEAAVAALTAANAALAADKSDLEGKNAKLNDKNKALEDELNALRNKPALENVEPAVFYFEIGQTKLNDKELAHLDFYLKNVLPHVDSKKVTVITGSADKRTGTTRRNEYLCQKRVDYLKNILVEKYGINVDNFQTKTVVANSKTPALDRAVIVSFE